MENGCCRFIHRFLLNTRLSDCLICPAASALPRICTRLWPCAESCVSHTDVTQDSSRLPERRKCKCELMSWATISVYRQKRLTAVLKVLRKIAWSFLDVKCRETPRPKIYSASLRVAISSCVGDCVRKRLRPRKKVGIVNSRCDSKDTRDSSCSAKSSRQVECEVIPTCNRTLWPSGSLIYWIFHYPACCRLVSCRMLSVLLFLPMFIGYSVPQWFVWVVPSVAMAD